MPENHGRGGRWTLLAALTFTRVAYGMQFQAVGAVGAAMVSDLGLDYTALGILVGAYSVLGMVFAFPAAWLMARFGPNQIVYTATALMTGGGLLMALAPTFIIAVLGRLSSGAGAVFLLVVLPTIIMDRFPGRGLPAAMGALLAGYPVGIGISAILLPLAGSWRAAMAATAAVAAVSLLAAVAALSDGGNATTVQRPRSVSPPRLQLAMVVAAGLTWGALNAGFAILLGFAGVFFVSHGYSLEAAGALVSLTAFATAPMGPVGGWLVGLIGKPITCIATGIVVVATAIALLPGDIVPAALLILVGITIGSIAGPIVSLTAPVLTPEQRAVGMGAFWFTFFALLSVLPPLAGLAHDLTHLASAPIYAASAFVACSLIGIAGFSLGRRSLRNRH